MTSCLLPNSRYLPAVPQLHVSQVVDRRCLVKLTPTVAGCAESNKARQSGSRTLTQGRNPTQGRKSNHSPQSHFFVRLELLLQFGSHPSIRFPPLPLSNPRQTSLFSCTLTHCHSSRESPDPRHLGRGIHSVFPLFSAWQGSQRITDPPNLSSHKIFPPKITPAVPCSPSRHNKDSLLQQVPY